MRMKMEYSQKETLQEKIKRWGLKPSSCRHPDAKAEVIFFLGNKVGAGMAKAFREAKERQAAREALEKAASSISEAKPSEEQKS